MALYIINFMCIVTALNRPLNVCIFLIIDITCITHPNYVHLILSVLLFLLS